MTGRTRRVGGWVVAAGLTLFAGCSQKVVVRTEPPGGRVVLDGNDLGAIPEDGVEVEVGPGLAAVPYTLSYDDKPPLSGAIPRDQVAWVSAVSGALGSAACVPLFGLLGFCASNPTLLAAPAACLSFSLSGIGITLSSPSIISVPCTIACATLGFFPLGLWLLAGEIPDDLVLAYPMAEATKAAPSRVRNEAASSTEGSTRGEAGTDERPALPPPDDVSPPVPEVVPEVHDGAPDERPPPTAHDRIRY